jgi:phenylacetate-CoA ligase
MLDFFLELHWRLSKTRESPGIHARIRELKAESALTAQAWQGHCERRLQNMLEFARKHVPWYRAAFQRAGIDSDGVRHIERMPILTKAEIRAHLQELIADTAKRSRMIANATGGSTGTPMQFYHDRQVQAVGDATDAYVRGWWGIKPYDRTALVWGADREFHSLSWREHFYHWRMRTRSLNAFRMTDQSLVEFCLMLMRWRPPYLAGYATALEALARCTARRGLEGLRFRAIRSAAETLWPAQRRLIEETFQSPVYNFYGSREIPNLAAECPEEKRLHLISTWRYVEIVDDKGCRLQPGERGYIVATDLSNYTMPFIRYRNEDMGQLSTQACPCGRPSPVLEELLGRSSDLIRTSRGDIVHGEFFTHLFYGRNDIQQFQVHQTALDRVVVRYVPAGDVAPSSLNDLAFRIRARLGDDVKIDLESCDHIPALASGKYRFTISDVSAAKLPA